MSAYIVSRDHIAYLVEASLSRRLCRGELAMRWRYDNQWHELRHGDTDRAVEVGNMLWAENIVSVSARYPHDDVDNLPGPIGENYAMRAANFRLAWSNVDPVQVIKACHCYEYQSCEHQGWEASEAKAFIDALVNRCTRVLDGYDDAAWGPPERNAQPLTR